MLSGYTIQETIAQRNKTIIYRGIRNSDSQRVIIKRLKSETPELKEIESLQNEYEISGNLDCPRIIKAYSLEADGNSYALILEDFGGQSLAEYLSVHPLSLEEFFTVGIHLAETLNQLHQIPIIHKDIKPSNIIINPNTQEVKLTDFNIAIRAPFEYPTLQNPNLMAGTFAYMSPEQTGRMNRYLDHRSDLYSLGVTFYEMLTGQLPYVSTDPLELIHSHLAQDPIPPHQLSANIPLGVSHVVLKLLAKSAEDRYQTAEGLKFDLESCVQQYQNYRTVNSFILGQRDRAPYLILPQKLYGREEEIQVLLNAFSTIQQGNSSFAVISGYAGIGKTSIVREIYPPVSQARGYFISGKFDQYKQETPYSAIIEAFQNLISQLLTTSAEEIAVWQKQIQTALGNNGKIIIDLIPELEILIGPQPDVPILEGQAIQNRFHRVFQQFTNVFSQAKHPLVLFLDDLQWADTASLKLIQYLVSNPNAKYFLLIGAYRDNEVKLTHPLLHILNQLKNEHNTKIIEITVQSLNIDQVHEFMADTFETKADPQKIQQLSHLVFEKTQGNPFFINQFLKTLDEEKIINYNYQADQWLWDLNVIQGVGLADLNLVELLARNFQKLPQTTQEILKAAACIGYQFSLSSLVKIHQCSSDFAKNNLEPALQQNFITIDSKGSKTSLNHGEIEYRFLHDRIQQAAYSLIPVTEKKATHLKIGQLLLQNSTEKEQEEILFVLVNQLNLGFDLLTSEEERQELVVQEALHE